MSKATPSAAAMVVIKLMLWGTVASCESRVLVRCHRRFARMSAPLEQTRERNQDSKPQPFDRRQLIERAKGLEDELLHHLPFADALAFFDARQRMQHIQAECRGNGEEKFPMLELEQGDLFD